MQLSGLISREELESRSPAGEGLLSAGLCFLRHRCWSRLGRISRRVAPPSPAGFHRGAACCTAHKELRVVEFLIRSVGCGSLAQMIR